MVRGVHDQDSGLGNALRHSRISLAIAARGSRGPSLSCADRDLAVLDQSLISKEQTCAILS